MGPGGQPAASGEGLDQADLAEVVSEVARASTVAGESMEAEGIAEQRQRAEQSGAERVPLFLSLIRNIP